MCERFLHATGNGGLEYTVCARVLCLVWCCCACSRRSRLAGPHSCSLEF